MSFFKNLSKQFYKEAKELNYTWLDLVKKTTRNKVIDDVRRLKKIKMFSKIEEDTIRNKIMDKLLTEMEDKIKRKHFEIMIEIDKLAKALKGNVESLKLASLTTKIHYYNYKIPEKQLKIIS